MKYKAPFFDEMYGKGGFYDEFPAETLLNADNDVNISRAGTLFSGGNYKRSSFHVLTGDAESQHDIEVIFNSIAATYGDYPPALVLEVEGGFAYRGAVYQLTDADDEELSVLYTTCRANDRPHIHELTPRDLSEKRVRTYDSTERRVLYLSSAGSFNYGHWIVDDLPRVKLLLDESRPTTVIVQSFPGMDGVREKSILSLCPGRDIRVEFLPAEEVAYAQKLTYVSPVSFHPYMKNPDAIAFLREEGRRRFGASVGGGDAPGRLIYVRRRAERGRILRNAAPVEKYLKERSFLIVDPERLSFPEQVEIFADASVIVGVMGAAMCNTVFSRPDASVIYLAPDNWVEPFYWDLASVLGHNYHAVHGRRMRINDAPHLDDFSIDTSLLAIALKRAMA